WLDIVNEVHNLKNKNLDILSLMKKKISNGSDTSFWEETWRGDHSFSTSFARIFALEDDKSITVARKMAYDDLTFCLRRNPRDGAEAMQFSELKAILDGLLLSSAKDRWSWSIDGSEEFSVASTRRLLDDHLLQGTSVKTRWVKEVPIKINIMAWKVRFDYLPSRFNLSKRGLDILDICCPTCTHEAETTNHIFFSCTMVREIYLKIAHWWDVRYSNFSSYEDWYDWLSNLKMHPKRRDNLEGVCYIMWWLVWKFRNQSLFGTSLPLKANLFDEIVNRSFYWCKYRSKASFSWVDWLKNPSLISL
ncbi:RNA-directed DNA polymerase, eukaryota, partial [Tanacetum coccineum]